jgi:hypothetical protein
LREIISVQVPDVCIVGTAHSTVFAMNGPHFGDRYGIAEEILNALNHYRIRPFGLCCSIASITCATSGKDTAPAIKAIQECFEVPAVITKYD